MKKLIERTIFYDGRYKQTKEVYKVEGVKELSRIIKRLKVY